MRVEVGARAPAGARLEAGGGQFGAALARAARRDDRAAKARSRPAPPRRPPAPASAGHPAERAAGPGEALRPSLAEREARAIGVEVEPVSTLGAAIQVLPAAVAAANAAGGAPLALSFGRSLDVELRAGVAGIEVVLRPEPALAHAARAELPQIVAALRRQGVAVARAEVRPQGSSGRRAR